MDKGHRRTVSDYSSHRRTASDDLRNVNFTDSDDDFPIPPPELMGVLSKWTNYIHGWQDRYITLKEGALSYYKSKSDTGYGCRGSISIRKAMIKPHEFDECRFDVSVNDCVWYLRTEKPHQRQAWVDALEAWKAESGYGSENSLRRHGSSVSITSNTLSTASTSSFRHGRGLREKLSEMETFRDILCKQIDTLQSYFDICADTDGVTVPVGSDSETTDCGGDTADTPTLINHAVDFKGEALTFKATTSGLLASLSHCMDIMTQRDELWRSRVEKEIEKRKKAEETCKQTAQEARCRHLGGPDYEEGPHSQLNEEEFFDAVESGLDKLEEEEKMIERRTQFKYSVPTTTQTLTSHPLWPEIEKVTEEQTTYALSTVDSGIWQLFAEEGSMRMYKREEEVDGMVCDPLKAVHEVQGFTAYEMCHYFFDPQVRMEWETSVENMKVVEAISDNTLVFLQLHKRVWPTTQRDSLFWSHIRKVENQQDENVSDTWIVCNKSTTHPDYPVPNKCLRVDLTVCMVCQTIINKPSNVKKLSREHLTCRITYCSVVNPGGWAPASVLRAVYKREYPRFLKRFTQYVTQQTEDNEITF